MAKKKTVGEITVKELTNRQLKQVFGIIKSDNVTEKLEAESENILAMCCDADIDTLLDMTPSEFEEIFSAFREVNDTLFNAAVSLNINQLFTGLKDLIIPTILKDFKTEWPEQTKLT